MLQDEDARMSVDETAEDYVSELTKNGPVELNVYGHQVGGHSLLMKFGKAVCKPMIPRENFFYTSIPQQIREFTPHYYGVANIRFQQTEDGTIRLLAVPPASLEGKENHTETVQMEIEEEADGTEVVGEVETLTLSHPIVRLDFFKATDGFSSHKHEDIVTETRHLKLALMASPHGVVHVRVLYVDSPTSYTTPVADLDGTFLNPWSLACMDSVQSVLSHYGPQQLEDMVQDYIVLEDLTSKYERPCILDLKMGTRQHGDDQSEAKKRKHIERCASSTSARLGVRISGMQVYNASKAVYTFKDKYYGRELNPEGFYNALHEFLQGETHLRKDIIPTLIEMLCQLKEMIEKQDSFRFFSSSLLVMYDGRINPSVESLISNSDVDIQPSSLSELETHSRNKTDLKTGLFTGSTGDVRKRNIDTCKSHCLTSDSVNGHRVKLVSEWGHEVPSMEKDPHDLHDNGLANARRLVDVRMIDFAHATNSLCTKDTIKYSGPDEGYILGLNTLISAFQTLGNT